MSIKHSCRSGLAFALTLVALTGCSSFVQQPAPIEAPTQTPISRAQVSPPVNGSSASTGAQTVPYRSDGSIRPDASPSNAQATVASDDGKTHVVQAGENLYRISLSHGLKYQVVASWNNLPDYGVKVGQVLRLTPPSSQQTGAQQSAPVQNDNVVKTPATKPYPKALKLAYSDNALNSINAQSEGVTKPASTPAKIDSSATAPSASDNAASAPQSNASTSCNPADLSWVWPVKGKLLRSFSEVNKGIDIGGRMGQPVVAAADGKVVYSDNKLRGYGKLIIIKHNKTFLSAYANNSLLLAKEGQVVKKGQKIAEMGNSDADQVKLHFEIRCFGKPTDPLQYLNSKP